MFCRCVSKAFTDMCNSMAVKPLQPQSMAVRAAAHRSRKNGLKAVCEEYLQNDTGLAFCVVARNGAKDSNQIIHDQLL